MAQKARLISLGIASQTGNFMGAGNVSNTQTATGSTSQANSFAIVDDVTIFTTAASTTGARLPLLSSTQYGGAPGDFFVIANNDANTLLVYPPSGGTINNGSLNASVNLTTKKCGIWFSVDGTNYVGGSLS